MIKDQYIFYLQLNELIDLLGLLCILFIRKNWISTRFKKVYNFIETLKTFNSSNISRKKHDAYNFFHFFKKDYIQKFEQF